MTLNRDGYKFDDVSKISKISKIKEFLNKCCGVIISVHDTNKILSRETKYIVDGVMKAKYGKSRIL